MNSPAAISSETSSTATTDPKRRVRPRTLIAAPVVAAEAPGPPAMAPMASMPRPSRLRRWVIEAEFSRISKHDFWRAAPVWWAAPRKIAPRVQSM